MASEDYALVHGMRSTRGTLERWQARPWPVLGRWALLSLAVTLLLLSAVLTVGYLAQPDETLLYLPGLHGSVDGSDLAHILAANSLVLALHACACVAGFIAGSSMRIEAGRRTGISKLVHEKAAAGAFIWVGAVTLFSLLTQAYALGLIASDISYGLEIEPWTLLATVLPHAIPELVALFLPLAAWLVASRRDEWDELLAATFVTVAIAIPVLIVSAIVEIAVWPELLQAASPVV